jgi:hypothetical protein
MLRSVGCDTLILRFGCGGSCRGPFSSFVAGGGLDTCAGRGLRPWPFRRPSVAGGRRPHAGRLQPLKQGEHVVSAGARVLGRRGREIQVKFSKHASSGWGGAPLDVTVGDAVGELDLERRERGVPVQHLLPFGLGFGDRQVEQFAGGVLGWEARVPQLKGVSGHAAT